MSRKSFWKSNQKKSAPPLNEEGEFKKNVKKLESLEETSRKIYKDTKQFYDSNAALSKAARKVSQDMLTATHTLHDDRLRSEAEKWNLANVKVDHSLTDLNNVCYKALFEPLKKMNGLCPSVHWYIKKHEQTLQEYNKCLQKLDKYQEKERTGTNIVKRDSARKAVESAREEFTGYNNLLMDELPKLYSQRIAYIEPCIEALIKSQVMQLTESYNSYSEISSLLHTKDDYYHSINEKLSSIKALSITIDD